MIVIVTKLCLISAENVFIVVLRSWVTNDLGQQETGNKGRKERRFATFIFLVHIIGVLNYKYISIVKRLFHRNMYK